MSAKPKILISDSLSTQAVQTFEDLGCEVTVSGKLTPEELAQRRAEHRSPLVARCVEDYQSGRRLPLDAIYQHPWPLQRG